MYLFIFLWTKIFFWNCQGAGHPRFHNVMNEYKKDFFSDLICLFETRVSRARVDGIIAKLGYPNSLKVEANRFASGIWLCWNENILVDILEIHCYMIHSRIRSKQGPDSFICSTVYASPHLTTRRKL
ncbi:hypothetical protein PVK06_048404 [Gossypium arboreum]|uniref:Uncharacterized protein n=1 Tax=Gossypium arboreum TaxID=29729 RepID=A0ABR0MG71_GOSAR|nr:hypothetical protein PVK06_048404 [Gossypium arboreum]